MRYFHVTENLCIFSSIFQFFIYEFFNNHLCLCSKRHLLLVLENVVSKCSVRTVKVVNSGHFRNFVCGWSTMLRSIRLDSFHMCGYSGTIAVVTEVTGFVM